MTRYSRLWLIVLLPLLGLMLLPAVYAAPAGSTPLESNDSGLDQNTALQFSQSVIGKFIGDYTLTNRAGQSVQLSQYRGKPLLVNFIYTGCFQVCRVTTRFLAKAIKTAQDAMGVNNFAAVSIGFNLPFDTPQALKAFAREQGAELPNWEFLSPDLATLPQLTRDFGFTYLATPKGFDHIVQVTIVDASGKIYRQVYGDTFEIPMLVGPLKELITGVPSPAPGFAGWLEKVRLLCTVYDPRLGTYRLNYGLFIEIFSGLSIIGAIGYLFISEWWRNRKIRV